MALMGTDAHDARSLESKSPLLTRAHAHKHKHGGDSKRGAGERGSGSPLCSTYTRVHVPSMAHFSTTGRQKKARKQRLTGNG